MQCAVVCCRVGACCWYERVSSAEGRMTGYMNKNKLSGYNSVLFERNLHFAVCRVLRYK